MTHDESHTDDGHRHALVGWWLFLGVLTVVLAYATTRILGVVLFGVFGYYAMRPIRDRLRGVVDADWIAATVTVLVVLVPVVLLVASLVVRAIGQVRRVLDGGGVPFADGLGRVTALALGESTTLSSLLEDPSAVAAGWQGSLPPTTDVVLGAIQSAVGTTMVLAFGLTLSYALLSRDAAISEALATLTGGRETAAYAYAAAVDADLESVFFGNVLFAAAVALLAVVAYRVTNLLAPDGLAVPMVLTLGLLTGVASLVPLVVGKLVYVPVVATLALQARGDPQSLAFVGGVLVAYLLVLDILPQTLVQPYVSSRRLDTVALLCTYLLGPVVFGWYGLFLAPILFVFALEAVRIVLPDLLAGTAPTPSVSLETGAGTDPRADRSDVPEGTGDDAQAAESSDSAAD